MATVVGEGQSSDFLRRVDLFSGTTVGESRKSTNTCVFCLFFVCVFFFTFYHGIKSRFKQAFGEYFFSFSNPPNKQTKRTVGEKKVHPQYDIEKT